MNCFSIAVVVISTCSVLKGISSRSCLQYWKLGFEWEAESLGRQVDRWNGVATAVVPMLWLSHFPSWTVRGANLELGEIFLRNRAPRIFPLNVSRNVVGFERYFGMKGGDLGIWGKHELRTIPRFSHSGFWIRAIRPECFIDLLVNGLDNFSSSMEIFDALTSLQHEKSNLELTLGSYEG